MKLKENSLLRKVCTKDNPNTMSHRKSSNPLPTDKLALPPIDRRSRSLENVSHRLSPLTPRKKSSLAASSGPLRALHKMGSTESPCSSGTTSPETPRSRSNSINNKGRMGRRRSSITANDITPLINHHPTPDDLIFDYKNQTIRHRQKVAFGSAVKDDDSSSVKSGSDHIVRVIPPDNWRDEEDSDVDDKPLTTDDLITACVKEADTACIVRTEVPEASDAFTRLKSEFLKSNVDSNLTVPKSPRERSSSIPQSFKWRGFRVITPAPSTENL